MTIVVNGSEREILSDMTLRDLIRDCSLKPEITAVQVNDAIIHRDDYERVELGEGDRVELVRIVGGG